MKKKLTASRRKRNRKRKEFRDGSAMASANKLEVEPPQWTRKPLMRFKVLHKNTREKHSQFSEFNSQLIKKCLNYKGNPIYTTKVWS